MKKFIVAPALVLAPVLAVMMSVAVVTPAMAASYGGEPSYNSHGLIAVLFGWFLPAVQ